MRCENKPLLQDDPRFFQDITSTAVEVGLRPEVFSGTSISQGAQYLGDGHGQFALSGGPRIAHRGGPVEPVLLLDKEDFDDTNTK